MLVHAAAMDPRYQKILASKLQEHAHNYTLTDVSFRSDIWPAPKPHVLQAHGYFICIPDIATKLPLCFLTYLVLVLVLQNCCR